MHYCQRCPVQVALRPAGELSGELSGEPAGDLAVCPECGSSEAVRRGPLYVVTGASGSGKSTVFPHLVAALPECVVFDVDWLIDPFELAGAPGPVNWTAFGDAWLSVAHGVAQGGRSTVLVGSFLPEQLADRPARPWITEIRVALLDCSDEQRRVRLDARPPWREHAVERHLAFADHLRRSIPTVVPTDRDPAHAAALLADWVRRPSVPGKVST